MTRKSCTFFFTGLDRSRLTNLDRSRFEKERNQYAIDVFGPGTDTVLAFAASSSTQLVFVLVVVGDTVFIQNGLGLHLFNHRR